MNKAQHTTRGIKHWGLGGYANSITRIKVYCTLIVKCPRSPQRFHTANVGCNAKKIAHMRMNLIIGLMIFILGCNSNSQSRIDFQLDSIANDTVSGLKTDFMQFDSVYINCKIKTSIQFKDLEFNLGKPDSIIKYSDKTANSEDSYSYIKYKNLDFHLYDNGQAVINKITIGNTNNKICYKDYEFNNLTTIDEIKGIFPKSYLHRDTINISGELLTAIRLFTAQKPTSDEFIMLFFENRLKYFSYFSGND